MCIFHLNIVAYQYSVQWAIIYKVLHYNSPPFILVNSFLFIVRNNYILCNCVALMKYLINPQDNRKYSTHFIRTNSNQIFSKVQINNKLYIWSTTNFGCNRANLVNASFWVSSAPQLFRIFRTRIYSSSFPISIGRETKLVTVVDIGTVTSVVTVPLLLTPLYNCDLVRILTVAVTAPCLCYL